MNTSLQQINRLAADRGQRWMVYGALRRGEHLWRYAPTRRAAEDLRDAYLADGLHQVRIVEPIPLTDPATQLAGLGRAWEEARDAERRAAAKAKAGIAAAAQLGLPETDIARLVRVDRMTVRRALGKN